MNLSPQYPFAVGFITRNAIFPLPALRPRRTLFILRSGKADLQTLSGPDCMAAYRSLDQIPATPAFDDARLL
ncbi:MAG: hypothetical protein HC834_08120 [Rhodospirillales bacterium]|nr:hypothetical protein [Rhodospirillales bacterium]